MSLFPWCISLCPSFYSHSWGGGSCKERDGPWLQLLVLKEGLGTTSASVPLKSPKKSLLQQGSPSTSWQLHHGLQAQFYSTTQKAREQQGQRLTIHSPILSSPKCSPSDWRDEEQNTKKHRYTDVIWLSWLYSKIIIIFLDVIQTWTWIFHRCNYTGNVFVI